MSGTLSPPVVWITYCSWGPWQNAVTVSVGIPPGFGAVRAVRRYGAALERLADA